ncbi:unnamed protein product [Spodoptera exigua]|nr:unnamed protein product [Spodoptera exigua]
MDYMVTLPPRQRCSQISCSIFGTLKSGAYGDGVLREVIGSGSLTRPALVKASQPVELEGSLSFCEAVMLAMKEADHVTAIRPSRRSKRHSSIMDSKDSPRRGRTREQ